MKMNKFIKLYVRARTRQLISQILDFSISVSAQITLRSNRKTIPIFIVTAALASFQSFAKKAKRTAFVRTNKQKKYMKFSSFCSNAHEWLNLKEKCTPQTIRLLLESRVTRVKIIGQLSKIKKVSIVLTACSSYLYTAYTIKINHKIHQQQQTMRKALWAVIQNRTRVKRDMM